MDALPFASSVQKKTLPPSLRKNFGGELSSLLHALENSAYSPQKPSKEELEALFQRSETLLSHILKRGLTAASKRRSVSISNTVNKGFGFYGRFFWDKAAALSKAETNKRLKTDVSKTTLSPNRRVCRLVRSKVLGISVTFIRDPLMLLTVRLTPFRAMEVFFQKKCVKF